MSVKIVLHRKLVSSVRLVRPMLTYVMYSYLSNTTGNCVCISDVEALLLLRMFYFYSLFFFFFLLIPISRQNLRSLLFPENKRYRIETLTRCAEWSKIRDRLLFRQFDLL